MDEIAQRLQDMAQACLESYQGWAAGNQGAKEREDLLESIHELRKAVARLEIEMAISDRDRMASKPLPIPPHRSQRKQSGQRGDNGPGPDDNDGDDGDSDNGGPEITSKPKRRGRRPKDSSAE